MFSSGNAGPVLFGVSEFVPILNHYMDRYQAKRHYGSNLVKVDGPNRTATFKEVDEQGNEVLVEETFDFLHAVPPQIAPEFVRQSTLSNDAGWLDVDQDTLQHVRFANVFGCGDIISAPNAKTAAAVRKQAPVVARNLVNFLKSKSVQYRRRLRFLPFDGRARQGGAGRIWLRRQTVAQLQRPGSNQAAIAVVKTQTDWLVPLYFDLMLKGREWMAGPNKGLGPAHRVHWLDVYLVRNRKTPSSPDDGVVNFGDPARDHHCGFVRHGANR